MKLNNKGQMIVLDVLFAVTLMILAFLLIFKFSEMEIYRANFQRPVDKLNRVGDLSYSLLFNNTEHACFVADTHNKFYLSGTLRSAKVITKEMLAIPSDYNCNLSISGISTECNSIVPTTGDIYATDFSIAVCSDNFTKNEYFNCVTSGSCSKISNVNGTLKIWRNN